MRFAAYFATIAGVFFVLGGSISKGITFIVIGAILFALTAPRSGQEDE